MPTLVPDPSLDIQTTPRPGPWIVWEEARPAARREGLLCDVAACANPDCPSADVDLEIVPIDTALASIEWSGYQHRKLSWKATPPADGVVGCRLDVSRATVDVSVRSPHSAAVADRLRRLLLPPLLDRLHDELCAARRLPSGPTNHVPADWQPGDYMPWLDAWRTPRLELVAFEGCEWLVDDQHCPKPNCDCNDTVIDFLPFDTEKKSAGETLGAVVVKPDGQWSLAGHRSGDDGVRLRELWGIYSARLGNVPRELERRRSTIRKSLGPLVTRPQPARKTSRVGRNEPCPCGSDRKYKRCCGRS